MVAPIGLDRFVQQNFGSDSLDMAERLKLLAFFVRQRDECGGHGHPLFVTVKQTDLASEGK